MSLARVLRMKRSSGKLATKTSSHDDPIVLQRLEGCGILRVRKPRLRTPGWRVRMRSAGRDARRCVGVTGCQGEQLDARHISRRARGCRGAGSSEELSLVS